MEKKKGKQRQMGVEGESWQRHHNKMSRCHNTFFPDKKKKSWGNGGERVLAISYGREPSSGTHAEWYMRPISFGTCLGRWEVTRCVARPVT